MAQRSLRQWCVAARTWSAVLRCVVLCGFALQHAAQCLVFPLVLTAPTLTFLL